MPDKILESLDEIAASLKQCFHVEHHQGIKIFPRSGRNLLATWWLDRVDYKPRRWEVSIRFPGNLIDRYAALDDAGRAKACINVRDTVLRFVGGLESLDEEQITKPASYICELDERMFD